MTRRRAFSYARFSTLEQLLGRSLKRQEAAAKSYCERHNLILDERSFTDFGVSAYKGANATHGALGEFLSLVKDGRIPKGSVLIVENIDRISRMTPDKATALLTEIIEAGVEVVTTSPEQVYTAENIHQPQTWIPLQVACCLASEESRKKGERLADAWAAKRSTAATEKLSMKGTFWVKITADRKGWIVLEDRAALVRKMFEVAADQGVSRISALLHQQCPEGPTGKGWQPAQIRAILRSRSVLGEYQPHTGTCAKKGRKSTRKPFGEPVKGYYPSIIGEDLFYRVQGCLDKRKRGGGRTTGVPNLFNGILYNAADGHKMTRHGTRYKTLVSAGAVRRVEGSVFSSVHYDTFETAILSCLKELRTSDVIGKPDAAAEKVTALSAKLTTLNRKLDQVRAKAKEAEDVSVFFDLLTDLDTEKKSLIADLEAAKAEAANQAGDNLGDFASLVELLATCPAEERDSLRSKIQAALRRIVSQMWVLVARKGKDVFLCVEVWFAATKSFRRYLIRYSLPGKWYASSMPIQALDKQATLRKKEWLEIITLSLLDYNPERDGYEKTGEIA